MQTWQSVKFLRNMFNLQEFQLFISFSLFPSRFSLCPAVVFPLKAYTPLLLQAPRHDGWRDSSFPPPCMWIKYPCTWPGRFSSLQPLCGAWSQAWGMMIVQFIYLHLYMQCNQSTKSNSYDTFGCSFFWDHTDIFRSPLKWFYPCPVVIKFS